MMIRGLKSIALLLAALLAWTSGGIEPRVLPTVATNIDDQWNGILPERPPVFPTATRIEPGQLVRIYVMASGLAIREGRARATYDIVLVDPQGKTVFEQKNIPLLDGAFQANWAALSPGGLEMFCEPQDPLGTYVLVVTVRDQVDGSERQARAELRLEKKTPAAARIDDRDFRLLLQLYYLQPRPELILPALRRVLTEEWPKAAKAQGERFRPEPMLAFFYWVLSRNAQLYPEFGRMIGELAPEQQLGALLIVRALGEKAEKVIVPELADALRRKLAELPPTNLFIPDPAKLDPLALDLWWAEFFATGKRAPILRLIQVLERSRNAATEEELKTLKGQKPNPETIGRVRNRMLVTVAQWSLTANARRHQLLRYYLEAMLRRGELKDDAARQGVEKALRDCQAPPPAAPASPAT